MEILLRIFQLVAPPCTQDGLCDLSKLTHVCRFWRVALINQPHIWSTVFITQKNRRSLVEMCLERSHPAPLDVTIEASKVGRARPECTCEGDRRHFLPNESNPCEWHFQFELLADTKHSNRIHVLEIDFRSKRVAKVQRVWFALANCRVFISSFPQLLTLTWKHDDEEHVDHPSSTPPFVSTLRSLTYMGPWPSMIASVNNLTSFVFQSDLGLGRTSVEAVRLFMLNNRFLESLTLRDVEFGGTPKGPPVHLSNLKFLSIDLIGKEFSTIIRVPAFHRLSSLRISSDEISTYTLDVTGDGIKFSAKCFVEDLAETWEDFTGYTRPTVRHIRLEGGLEVDDCDDHDTAFVSGFLDVHILEIGSGYIPLWYCGVLDELKQLGPRLKVIRFAIPDGLEQFGGSDGGEVWGCSLLEQIEDLVRHRFQQGRPFSAVERMVVGETDDGQQDYLWRRFYDSRRLGQYVRPE